MLPVTSAAEHQPNVAKLKTVDSPASKVEWIVSVSMLSEGWDVKNVFQIVPHEERAFNSKLLIAQVLGRGLRRPDGWQGADPVVTCSTTTRGPAALSIWWTRSSKSNAGWDHRVLDGSPYHFDLHNLDYTRETDTAHFTKKGEYRLLQQGYVELPSQVEVEDVAIEFEHAVTGQHTKFKTQIAHKTYSLEEVAEQMYRRLQSIDEESKDAEDPKDRTQYVKKFHAQAMLGDRNRLSTEGQDQKRQNHRGEPAEDPAGPRAAAAEDCQTRCLQAYSAGIDNRLHP